MCLKNGILSWILIYIYDEFVFNNMLFYANSANNSNLFNHRAIFNVLGTEIFTFKSNETTYSWI